MMEVVIVDDGNRLTVYELVERVIPCIIAKHYSENYIQGFVHDIKLVDGIYLLSSVTPSALSPRSPTR